MSPYLAIPAAAGAACASGVTCLWSVSIFEGLRLAAWFETLMIGTATFGWSIHFIVLIHAVLASMMGDPDER